jgi:hypothetical protein
MVVVKLLFKGEACRLHVRQVVGVLLLLVCVGLLGVEKKLNRNTIQAYASKPRTASFLVLKKMI